MYGTVAVCRVTQENVARIRELAAAEDAIGIEGYLGTDVMVPENHDDTLIMVVRFRDRDTYVANADSPAQDERYREFRALMDADPVWYDGDWMTEL